jgi:hypothetical protein
VRLGTTTYFERNRVVVAPLCFAGFQVETPNSFIILLAGVKINDPVIDNWRAIAVADVYLPILLKLLGQNGWAPIAMAGSPILNRPKNGPSNLSRIGR